MRLYLEELTTELSQRIKPSANTQVVYIRPHLYLHNVPSGSLSVHICSSDGTLISQSSALPISSITSSNEYHGYVRFEVDAFMKKDTYYTIKIVASGGYSFSESAYCAAVKDTGFQKYDYVDPVVNPTYAPLDLEVWSRSLK